MRHLKANTQVKVVIGPFVDVTDGFTPETGITLGAADEAELMKHDAAAVTDISAATWAAITSMDGYYNLTLTTSHTDTEGMLVIAIQDDSVCLPVRMEFMVLAEAAYDSLYTAKDTGYMDVNVKAVSEDTTAADNLELACDNYSVTRGLSGTALPAAAADAAGGLPISDAGGLDLDAMNTNINDIETDTAAMQPIIANLPTGYKKNTAANNFPFVMVDSTDGYTPETGLTVTATRSIDGAAYGACANSVSEIGNGTYKINLAAADLNGDEIILRFTASGARDRIITIKTNT